MERQWAFGYASVVLRARRYVQQEWPVSYDFVGQRPCVEATANAYCSIVFHLSLQEVGFYSWQLIQQFGLFPYFWFLERLWPIDRYGFGCCFVRTASAVQFDAHWLPCFPFSEKWHICIYVGSSTVDGRSHTGIHMRSWPQSRCISVFACALLKS